MSKLSTFTAIRRELIDHIDLVIGESEDWEGLAERLADSLIDHDWVISSPEANQ